MRQTNPSAGPALDGPHTGAVSPGGVAVPASGSGRATNAICQAIGEKELIWMMGMLMALQAFGIDAILPGLDDVAASLGVVGNDRQFVVGAYLIAAGFGALLPGALADRFGRRPVLLVSIGLYVVFSILSSLVTDFTALVVIRALQGFFGAGIIALPPAIIRDRVGGDRMARMMSLIFMIFLITPAVAPSIGQGILFALGDWRWIFAAMAVQGTIIGVWVYTRLPESLAEEHRQEIRPKAIAHNMKRAISLRSANGYIFGGALVIGGLFGFINSAEQLIGGAFGAETLFPLIFGVCAAFMAVTNFFNSRIVERFGARRVSHTALLVFVAISGVQVLATLQADQPLWQFVALMALNMALLGFIGTNFGSIAMNPFFDIAGAASSIQASLRLTMGAVLGALIGYAYDGTAFPFAISLFVLSLAGLLLVLYSERGKLFGPPQEEMGRG